MRRRIFLFAFILLAFIGCKENSNPTLNEYDGSLSISGKITNFNSSFNKVYTYESHNSDSLKMIESEIQTDGSFNLNIPIPSENQLTTYTPQNHISITNGDSIIFIDSIEIVDNNLKYNRLDISALSEGNITYSLPLNLAKISNLGEFAKVGDYYITYYYFNIATKIQGYYKWKVVTSDSTREIITEFNVNTKIGWNKVITKFKSENNNRAIYEVTQISNEQGDWLIGARNSFTNAVRIF